MSDRNSIIGFTEAELGFFLALLFLGLYSVNQLHAKPKPPPQATMIAVPRRTLDSLRAAIEEAQKRADSLAAENAKLRPKRSNLTPTCEEKGIISGSLGDVTILGPNRFEYQGAQTDIQGILSEEVDALREARENGCRHRVKIYYLPTLKADDLATGLRRLQGYFYGGLNGKATR